MTKRSTCPSYCPSQDGRRARWLVLDEAGAGHLPRESEGEHHMTVCGRYLRGPRLPADTTSCRRRCPTCKHRLDVGFMMVDEDAEERVPAAVARGRGTRGKCQARPRAFSRERAE